MSTTPERALEAKLAAIADHFALGLVQTFERTSGTNQNYLVTTSVGDYLFKILVNTTLEDMLKGLPFLQRLEEQGFTATAYYLKAPNGQVFYQSPACDVPSERPTSHWTGRELAEEAITRGIVKSISPRHAMRLLKRGPSNPI